MPVPDFDPALDLVLERTIPVSIDRVWRAWTVPEVLVKWFTPAPWSTVACELDLRPGGRFHTVMQSPEGEKFPNTGCFLEIVPGSKLVWTSALGAGYRPAVSQRHDLLFTATLLLTPVGAGTKYVAVAQHPEAAVAKRHEEMGFHAGWGAALDQLVTLGPSI